MSIVDREQIRRGWFRFRRNLLSLVGLAVVAVIAYLAIFAPLVAPYPEQMGPFVDFANAGKSPDAVNWLGTDLVGRDILTRILFAYRISLGIAIIVLAIAAPVGIIVGLVAGYVGGWTELVLMRLVDVFLAVPPLVLALAILGVFSPSLINAVLAIAAMWWPWYARLAYSMTRSVARADFVVSARVVGASHSHIMLREILPNLYGPLLTKITLDMGLVILMAASLGFLGLGVQAPTPELGAMVAEGAASLSYMWWLALFPGGAILFAILGFNLLGDGIADVLDGGD